MAVPVPPVNPRYPPYPGGSPTSGGGSGGSSGGGSTGSGSGIYVPTSNGGVFAQSQVAIYPCTNVITGKTECRTFDVTQPANDPNYPSSYSWRVEQYLPYRNPSIRKILWTFTDLGQVTAVWTLQGVDEKFAVHSSVTPITAGNFIPTYAIMTTEVDIQGGVFTAMNMQLSVSKAAGAGPLSVLQVVLVGEIEEFSP